MLLISPPAGLPGDTSATHTGTLVYAGNPPQDAAGARLVEAATPQEAVGTALTGIITVQLGSQSWQHPVLPGSVGGTQVEHKPFWFDGMTLRLEDLAGAPALSDWDYNDRRWPVSVTPHIPDTPPAIAGDLDVIDKDNNPVAEDKETAVGGWVPLNNDNDNYNFPTATSLAHIYDRDETAQVVGEDDLIKVQFTLPQSPPTPGEYKLTLGGIGLRVWGTSEKESQKFTGGATTYTLQGSGAVWVEGFHTSFTPRDNALTLTFTDFATSTTSTVDVVRFTVYGVSGAMNVPGYSKHTYQAEVAGGQPRFAGGNAATGVTSDPIVQHPYTALQQRTARVLWDGGPAVGTYRVYPTADDNFYVDRQVNVVKVEISAVAGADNKLGYYNADNPADRRFDAPWQVEGLRNFITSVRYFPTGVAQIPTMKAELTIKKLEGPTVNGGVRGVRFIEAGMIQNATFEQMHGVFEMFSTGVKHRAFTLEGNSYLDVITQGVTVNLPWYRDGNSWGLDGVYRSSGDPAVGMPATNIPLGAGDQPMMYATDKMILTETVPYVENGVTVMVEVARLVNRFELVFDLMLYFAVRTREAVNGSDTVYTQRGKAHWWFNGSGDINWQYDSYEDAVVGKWQRSLALANNGDAAFAEITDGTVIPITTAPVTNEQFYDQDPNFSDYWVTKNP